MRVPIISAFSISLFGCAIADIDNKPVSTPAIELAKITDMGRGYRHLFSIELRKKCSRLAIEEDICLGAIRSIDIDKIDVMMARMYDKYLNRKDIIDSIEFYKTESGKKYQDTVRVRVIADYEERQFFEYPTMSINNEIDIRNYFESDAGRAMQAMLLDHFDELKSEMGKYCTDIARENGIY